MTDQIEIPPVLPRGGDVRGKRVVLTGASSDGALGAARVKAAGGTLFVQDPDDAECAVMPRAALAAAKADRVLALDQIGPALNLFAAMARHGG